MARVWVEPAGAQAEGGPAGARVLAEQVVLLELAGVPARARRLEQADRRVLRAERLEQADRRVLQAEQPAARAGS